MVGVSWFGSPDDMEAFVQRHGLSFTNVDDRDGVVFERFGVPGQPAWAFVAADGTVTTRTGSLDDDELWAALDSTLTAAGDGQSS